MISFATLEGASAKHLIDTIAQAVFLIDVLPGEQFCYLAINRRGEELSGISHEQFSGCRPDELMPQDQANWVCGNYRYCLRAASAVTYEELLEMPTGVRWWQTTLAPVFDDTGRVTRIFGSAIDITELKARERDAAHQEYHYQSLFDHAPISLWEEDYSLVKASLDRLIASGVSDVGAYLRANPDEVRALLTQVLITDVNQAALRLYKAADKASLLRTLEVIIPDPTIGFMQELEALAADCDTVEFFTEVRTLTGEPLEVQVKVLFRELSDDYSRVIVAVDDVTARKQAERDKNEQNQWLKTIFRSMADAIIATDTDGSILMMNPPAEALSGWSEAQVRGLQSHTLFHFSESLTGCSLPDPLQQALHQGGKVTLPELVLLSDRHGETIPVRCTAAPICVEQGEILGAVMVLSPIADRSTSHVGALLGEQPGSERQVLEVHLTAALSSLSEGHPPCVLLYLVLERFSLLTEVVGHNGGLALLQHIANRLRERIRHTDLLVSLNVPEFAVLLQPCSLDRASSVADELRQTVLETSLEWEDRCFNVGVTIAVVPVVDTSSTPERLLQTALGACASARESNPGGSIQVVKPDSPMIRQRREELHYLGGLRDAMNSGRLRLYGQPVVDAEGQTAYMELLIRLLDPQGQVISPGAFIPAAERYGLIGELDRWVIRQALERYREWFPEVDVGIGINLSGLSLDDELAGFIGEQLRISGLPPGLVHFEITETAAISNMSGALSLIEHLGRLGCRFYLDDFGSGLSSFAYLSRLPVDGIKIDRSFISELRWGSVDYTFVKCFMLVARRLGLRTVAEGLEDLNKLPLLHELGVDLVQGYALGRPAPLPWSKPD